MSKEKTIWDLASAILDTHGNEVECLSIIETGGMFGDDGRTIYHRDGHCFKLTMIPADPDDACDVEDGFVYVFDEPFEGYHRAGIDRAIELLSEYAEL